MRARNIKPGFFIDSKIGKLTDSEKILFIGLWCLADKEGFFEFDLSQILIQIFPYNRKLKPENIKKMLSNLIQLNLIVSNEAYGLIPGFVKHQHPHPEEAKSRVSEENKLFLKSLINQPNKISLDLMKSRADIMNYDIMKEDIMNDVYAPASATQTSYIFKGAKLKIPTVNHESFLKTFPGVSLEEEYQKMDTWLLSNLHKPKKNHASFARNWLEKTFRELKFNRNNGGKQTIAEKKAIIESTMEKIRQAQEGNITPEVKKLNG